MSVLRPSRHPRPRLTRDELATAWQALSVLLDYPGEELLQRKEVLAAAASGLPRPVQQPMHRFLVGLVPQTLGQRQREYVETFDVTRRCCLYLTYFAHGDTRKRGLALVQFKQSYRKAGAQFDADELPDHLSVVLEFGAAYDVDTAWRLLNDHRAGIEMLRMALAERQSPWHDIVLALVATLPDLKGEDAEKLQQLIAQGPPAEEVGLDLQPYAMDPRLNPQPRESVELGRTIPVGAP
jgi:nitrate reductase delta subunit